MIPESVIKEWSEKIPYIQCRINKVNKRIKKYEKQKKHFEMRLKLAKEYLKKQEVNNG
jgi:hypothetical protein